MKIFKIILVMFTIFNGLCASASSSNCNDDNLLIPKDIYAPFIVMPSDSAYYYEAVPRNLADGNVNLSMYNPKKHEITRKKIQSSFVLNFYEYVVRAPIDSVTVPWTFGTGGSINITIPKGRALKSGHLIVYPKFTKSDQELFKVADDEQIYFAFEVIPAEDGSLQIGSSVMTVRKLGSAAVRKKFFHDLYFSEWSVDSCSCAPKFDIDVVNVTPAASQRAGQS